MFGNNARASWGTSEWGDVLPTPGAVFSVDGVCQGDEDRLVSVDALASLTSDLTVEADGLVQAEGEAAFAVDAATAILPPEVYGQLTTSPYVLAELDLPGGPVRVSDKHRCALGETWGARLVRSGSVLRSIGAGTDDFRLELDDTTSSGAQRFRDLFAADNPEGSGVKVWLGAEGAEDHEHVLIFDGKLEQVQGFSETVVRVQVVRREQVEDVLLGQLVDEATFPDAPDESLSSMLPIVFGEVEAHEGVVVNTLEVGSLRFNTFAADTQVELVDGAAFPATGVVMIDSEEIAYAGKVGDDRLVSLTRGFNGTQAADHSKGSEVAEVGPFTVKWASHPLGYMKTFKLILPNGNLGDPVPQPTTVDHANALATWPDGLPQIRDPDARPTYQRVHFRDPALTNTATNPQFAARENLGYEAFKVAQVPPANNLVLVTNTDDLADAGDIQRVWIGILFDPDSISFGSVFVSSAFYLLLPTDTVPDEIARNDERTGDRIYDVPPPVIDVTAPAPVGFSATPQEVVDPGLFVTVSRASNVVDKNDDTFACYQFVGVGEALVAGGGDVVCRWTQQEWEAAFPPGGQSVSMEIRALMGTRLVPLSSPWEVYLQLDGKEIAGTRLLCSTLTPLGLPAGFIRGVEEFLLDVTGAVDPFQGLDANGLAIWERLEMVLHPITGVSSGLWCGHEVSIQGDNRPPKPTVSATQDTRQSVTNYFEVTSLLPVVDGRVPWSVFSDPLLLGQARFTGNASQELRVLETFWVVEFTPFVAASSRVPRTFANVSGLVPSGDPVEIARTLVTRAAPEGMGLGVDRIDQGSYLAAQASLSADAVRLDFALREQAQAVELLSLVASQADCRDTWENEVHRLVRLPRSDQVLAVARTLTCGDVLDEGPGVSSKQISRSSVRQVANRITTLWRPYAPSGETSRTLTVNDAPSQASKLGLREAVLELVLVQDDATAALVSQRKLERIRVPRWIVTMDVPIYGMSYRPGDLIAFTDTDFGFQVGEITQVNLKTDRLRRVGLEVVVWNK